MYFKTRMYSSHSILPSYSYPAGSGFSGNDGASTFEAHACFQFFGTYLSTIALNASCTTTY